MSKIMLVVSDQGADTYVYGCLLRKGRVDCSILFFASHEEAEEHLRANPQAAIDGALIQYYLRGGDTAAPEFLDYVSERIPHAYLTCVVDPGGLADIAKNHRFLGLLIKPILADTLLGLEFLKSDSEKAA